MIDTIDNLEGTVVVGHFRFGIYPRFSIKGVIAVCWRVGRNSIVDDIHSLNTEGQGGDYG